MEHNSESKCVQICIKVSIFYPLENLDPSILNKFKLTLIHFHPHKKIWKFPSFEATPSDLHRKKKKNSLTAFMAPTFLFSAKFSLDKFRYYWYNITVTFDLTFASSCKPFKFCEALTDKLAEEQNSSCKFSAVSFQTVLAVSLKTLNSSFPRSLVNYRSKSAYPQSPAKAIFQTASNSLLGNETHLNSGAGSWSRWFQINFSRYRVHTIVMKCAIWFFSSQGRV